MIKKIRAIVTKELLIQNITIAVFFGLAAAYLIGSFDKLLTTNTGQHQLANLIGEDNARQIIALRSGFSSQDNISGQMIANVDDTIMTGSIIQPSSESETYLNDQYSGHMPDMPKMRNVSNLYIVELGNSEAVAPLRQRLKELQLQHAFLSQKGFPYIRKHVNNDFPEGQYFLYIEQYSNIDQAHYSCLEYMREGVSCATTLIRSLQQN